ncbi:MAG TPA: alanine dehydrogenase [Firmicutes bacterium]|nr:alanine dehydrogenase [Bacillota bacterium]
MIIGVVRELKAQENRVAMTPAGVDALTACGHRVLVEKGAGCGAGFSDESYKAAGAQIVTEAADVWEKCELMVKVKEPHESEYQYLRPDLVFFAYLHLAADPELTKTLLASGVTAIAYETVQRSDRSLPLLTPMSEVAGRMAIQEGAIFLEKTRGGKGILLEGVPGVTPGSVVVVGGGTVGMGAIRRAMGLGARVTVVDVNVDRLRYLEDIFMGRIETLYSNRYNLSKAARHADLIVGAVLVPGAKAPKVITEDMVKKMQPGSVIVDVAIDQGGCVETIKYPTTHADPVFIKHGVIHYAVPNIPGAVPRTSTLALTNATLPYLLELAKKGWKQAVMDDEALAKGVNMVGGKLTNAAVAEAHDLPCYPLEEVIASF